LAFAVLPVDSLIFHLSFAQLVDAALLLPFLPFREDVSSKAKRTQAHHGVSKTMALSAALTADIALAERKGASASPLARRLAQRRVWRRIERLPTGRGPAFFHSLDPAEAALFRAMCRRLGHLVLLAPTAKHLSCPVSDTGQCSQSQNLASPSAFPAGVTPVLDVLFFFQI
jgi:hypothetical protein